MQPGFQPPGDVEERARRCIRANHLTLADGRISALIELVKALRRKLIQNIRAGAGLIFKEVPDPSNLRPQLATIKGFGAFSDLEVAFLICAKDGVRLTHCTEVARGHGVEQAKEEDRRPSAPNPILTPPILPPHH